MNKQVFMAVIGIALFIIFLVWNTKRKNKQLIEELNDSFGEKPKNFNQKFDMTFIKKFYSVRKEIEKTEDEFEEIDELTWNDLDMDKVFKRINYTNTTLGESYLYYKLKRIEYNKKEWDITEKFIRSIRNDEELRNDITLKLLKVGKIKNSTIYNFIYNPKFNKIKGYYKYPILALGFIASIILCFIDLNKGIFPLILFLCTNILSYQKLKMYLDKDFDNMMYLLNNVVACQKLCKIKKEEFNEIRNNINEILSDCKDLKKVKRYGKYLSKGSGAALDADLFLVYIKMFFMVDVIAYQNILNIFEKNRESFCKIYDVIAKIDFAISIAYYRESIDTYTIPDFISSDEIILEDVYHPLLNKPVKNSINITNNILFTGSNASGKSTFIKSIALNCIFSQSLNTALCTKYKCKFSKVITSMAIKDDISQGDSYFISEIKSLKRLIDSLNGNIRVLAFVDEILKGTNTIERISASASMMKYAKDTKGRMLVATHDIELTEMLRNYYDNYHFREKITEDSVLFDYKLHEGPSTTRNAIKLLKTMKFDSDLVECANNICDKFIQTKKWDKL